jgi:DNA repair protein RadA/Sms
MMLRYAKESGVPVILIGHITKDGTLAGPKVLEHIVDVVLQFEGDGNYVFRILRPVKNRFGSTAEIGIFEMGSGGLREVTDPRSCSSAVTVIRPAGSQLPPPLTG